MKNIEIGHFHHTLVSALSCVLLMAVAGSISEHMLYIVSIYNLVSYAFADMGTA